MKQNFGYYIVIGLVIGAIFGMGLGAANDSAIAGIAIGSLAGVFMGWFFAAIALEKSNEAQKTNKR
jgi:membrane associated rhomboid family serine protease